MYDPPRSPLTTITSPSEAPDRFTAFFLSTLPMQVTDIISPLLLDVVSPPTKSRLYSEHAALIPS